MAARGDFRASPLHRSHMHTYTFDQREARRLDLDRIARNQLEGDLTTDSARNAFCARLSDMPDVEIPERADTDDYLTACEQLYRTFRGEQYAPKDMTLYHAVCDRVARKAGYVSFDDTSKLEFQPLVQQELRAYQIQGVNITRVRATEELIDRHATIIYGRLSKRLKLGKHRSTRTKSDWQALAMSIDSILRASPNVAVSVSQLATSLGVTSDEIRHCAKFTFIQPLDGKQGTQAYHAVNVEGKRISHDKRCQTAQPHHGYIFVSKAESVHEVQRALDSLQDGMSGLRWRKATGMMAERFYAAKAALLEAGMTIEASGVRGAKVYTRAYGDIELAKALYVKPRAVRTKQVEPAEVQPAKQSILDAPKRIGIVRRTSNNPIVDYLPESAHRMEQTWRKLNTRRQQSTSLDDALAGLRA